MSAHLHVRKVGARSLVSITGAGSALWSVWRRGRGCPPASNRDFFVAVATVDAAPAGHLSTTRAPRAVSRHAHRPCDCRSRPAAEMASSELQAMLNRRRALNGEKLDARDPAPTASKLRAAEAPTRKIATERYRRAAAGGATAEAATTPSSGANETGDPGRSDANEHPVRSVTPPSPPQARSPARGGAGGQTAGESSGGIAPSPRRVEVPSPASAAAETPPTLKRAPSRRKKNKKKTRGAFEDESDGEYSDEAEGGEAGGTDSVKWVSADAASLSEASTFRVENVEGILCATRTRARHPTNLVSIFGPARSGKSTIMNHLATATNTGIFTVSSSFKPCTTGIDISRTVLTRAELVDRCGGDSDSEDDSEEDHADAASAPLIAFADAEGQGDHNETYDAKLIAPVLLTSRVVLFNTREMNKDRVLQQLHVFLKAASRISADDDDDDEVGSDGDDDAEPSMFGHLHIVFRDSDHLKGKTSDLKDAIFAQERKNKHKEEVATRNQIRERLSAAFASISVWKFPAPTSTNVDKFTSKVNKLRSAILRNVREPHILAGGIVTGSVLARLMPKFVEAVNSDETICPATSFELYQREEAVREVSRAIDAVTTVLSAVKTLPLPASAHDALHVAYDALVEEAAANVRSALPETFDRILKEEIAKVGSDTKAALLEAQGAAKEAAEALRTKLVEDARGIVRAAAFVTDTESSTTSSFADLADAMCKVVRDARDAASADGDAADAAVRSAAKRILDDAQDAAVTGATATVGRILASLTSKEGKHVAKLGTNFICTDSAVWTAVTDELLASVRKAASASAATAEGEVCRIEADEYRKRLAEAARRREQLVATANAEASSAVASMRTFITTADLAADTYAEALCSKATRIVAELRATLDVADVTADIVAAVVTDELMHDLAPDVQAVATELEAAHIAAEVAKVLPAGSASVSASAIDDHANEVATTRIAVIDASDIADHFSDAAARAIRAAIRNEVRTAAATTRLKNAEREQAEAEARHAKELEEAAAAARAAEQSRSSDGLSARDYEQQIALLFAATALGGGAGGRSGDRREHRRRRERTLPPSDDESFDDESFGFCAPSPEPVDYESFGLRAPSPEPVYHRRRRASMSDSMSTLREMAQALGIPSNTGGRSRRTKADIVDDINACL
mmetsp:Transcript_17931/g.63283  ORF Transcript_17931/g.63283 Transcript_17931/m.63283 type:complete len:1156 (-) Transcript_17931:2213-5680(-)